MTHINDFEKLSLEQKLGQLFFIGIPGTEIDEQTTDLLEKISPGGICLFSRNIKTSQRNPQTSR